jgi:hypothetical protein
LGHNRYNRQPTEGRERGDGEEDGGLEKEPQPTILFLCDVNIAAGGHVDFKSTHYYYCLHKEI